MDEWITAWIRQLQWQAWKPILTALVLPPVPLLLLLLVAVGMARVRRGLAWAVALAAAALLWLSCTQGLGAMLGAALLDPPPALSIARIAEIRQQVAARTPIAIVVLGGGREVLAPEYAGANLSPLSSERLRYGLWLARETNAGVGFSGGVGWAQTGSGASEAEIAAGIARQDYGRSLRWVEGRSRDTRENAEMMTAMLAADGIREVLLVTHGWHMPRALRAFRQAAAGRIEVVAAPMGLAPVQEAGALKWLPSAEGFSRVRQVLREALGLLMGS